MNIDQVNFPITLNDVNPLSTVTSLQEEIPKQKELQINMLRLIKVFPIFENQALAKFSVNYFLYLEFYHMAIRIICKMLAFATIAYTVYMAIKFALGDEYDDQLGWSSPWGFLRCCIFFTKSSTYHGTEAHFTESGDI